MDVQILVLALCLGTAGCGAAAPGGHRVAQASPAPTPIATGSNAAPVATQIPEQMVIEGTLAVEVDEIGDVVPSLRALVEQAGGRVINEVVSGAEKSWNAQLKLRIPPNKVDDVVGFLAKRGQITDKRITATDVSKQLFDQQLALENLRTTLDRLHELMKQGGLKIQDILQVEQEMTRLRGQIEQIEGEQRFLKDRVALATLDVSMTRKEGAVTVAKAKVYPGVRGAALVLFDPGTRERTRYGVGFVLHTLLRANTLEIDVFQKEPNAAGTSSSNAVIATIGGAVYSDFLGGGRRQVLDPYLGFRIGYGYLDDHKFVLQGEAGVELFKHRNAVVDLSARATGLIGSSSELALVTAVGATFAF